MQYNTHRHRPQCPVAATSWNGLDRITKVWVNLYTVPFRISGACRNWQSAPKVRLHKYSRTYMSTSLNTQSVFHHRKRSHEIYFLFVTPELDRVSRFPAGSMWRSRYPPHLELENSRNITPDAKDREVEGGRRTYFLRWGDLHMSLCTRFSLFL